MVWYVCQVVQLYVEAGQAIGDVPLLLLMPLWVSSKYHFKLYGHIGIPLIQYGNCSKISYTKVSNKMAYANSADQDQTAPEGAV